MTCRLSRIARALVIPALLAVYVAVFPAAAHPQARPVSSHVVARAEHTASFDAALRVVRDGDLQPLDFVLHDYQLGRLGEAELRILRNTIFARYGHRFRSPDLQAHFEGFDWYEPVDGDSGSLVTQVDRRNIDRIRVFEDAWRRAQTGDFVSYRASPELLAGGYQLGGPPVAAGYSTRYEFSYPYFTYYKNEMVADERLVSFGGTWEIEGPFLVLCVGRYTKLEGGSFEPGGYGSVASDWVLVDATVAAVDLGGCFELRLPLRDIGPRTVTEDLEVEFVTIGDAAYGRVYR